MRDGYLIAEFEKHKEAINELQDVNTRLAQHIVGCDARIRVWEAMLLKRGGFLRLAVKNLFAPDSVKLEIFARFKKASDFTPAKPKDSIEITTVKTDEELKAELARGAK